LWSIARQLHHLSNCIIFILSLVKVVIKNVKTIQSSDELKIFFWMRIGQLSCMGRAICESLNELLGGGGDCKFDLWEKWLYHAQMKSQLQDNFPFFVSPSSSLTHSIALNLLPWIIDFFYWLLLESASLYLVVGNSINYNMPFSLSHTHTHKIMN
jgi:hypothetical protein